jgi:FtsP/CotA-like multicopper oxidase with cupredoxin domain
MGPGERVDVVVDFSKLPASTTAIYMVNRADQTDGRGPHGTPLPLSLSPKLIMFKILPGAVEDPSRVPSVLRPQDPISAADIRDAVRRTWRFDRNGGAWTVNGNLFDPTRVDARVVQGRPEIWTISTSGGWWHPIHFHVEEGRILSVNGGEEGDTALLGRKDVFPLHGGYEMEVFVKFRDWIGKYPMHCHNSSHEDHAMMVRFDVVAPG